MIEINKITDVKAHLDGVSGVIFDLDDTLYGEKQYVLSGYKEIARFLNEPNALEELWSFFKAGLPAIDEYLKKHGKPQLKEKCLEIYRSHYPDIRLYEGAAELLKSLKQENKKLGIITDGRVEGQKNKIAALGLEKAFDDIIITDELGGVRFRKPNDAAFRIIQGRWKLPFNRLVYIGDNIAKDFIAPEKLGMKYIYYRNPDGLYLK